MIRILIADDHLLFRSMLEEMLKRDGELKIVASCADGYEVLQNCRMEKPDIVLLDIGMPGKGGIEALKEIKTRWPQIKVVMLTTFEDDENIKSAIQLGADGYLIKDMKPEILIISLKCIYHGMVLFHRGVYGFLRSAVLDACSEKNKKVQIDNMLFDAVDIKILQLIVQGKSNRDIGLALNYSEGTIKNKVTRLLSQTGFSNRTELSVFAINHELV
ncbi:response regulator transcription factor [Anaerotignum sp.]|uniref:response regulator transcription factor n=1 Tax=Anaerotignum sp. TaxID=2039241 RepID=UPI0027146BF7|nr:response regulator transcription factor [Anaerotignum sp.]